MNGNINDPASLAEQVFIHKVSECLGMAYSELPRQEVIEDSLALVDRDLADPECDEPRRVVLSHTRSLLVLARAYNDAYMKGLEAARAYVRAVIAEQEAENKGAAVDPRHMAAMLTLSSSKDHPDAVN